MLPGAEKKQAGDITATSLTGPFVWQAPKEKLPLLHSETLKHPSLGPPRFFRKQTACNFQLKSWLLFRFGWLDLHLQPEACESSEPPLVLRAI